MTLDILLPFWGDPELLRQTVASVCAQDDADWTLTVVDDCYPDPSVAGWFAKLGDPRITYHRNVDNLGITDNYRRCLELATGPWIVFLGCDDVLLHNYVDVIKRAIAENPDASIIQPGVEIIDETGATTKSLADTVKRRISRPNGATTIRLQGETLAVSLLRGNWLYWPSLAFRKMHFEEFGFRDGLPIVQDLAIIMDHVFADRVLVHVPELAFQYRRHSESASAASVYDGRRFTGDRTYFGIAAAQAHGRGWPRAERAAKLRVTSRAHALSLVPGALVNGKARAVPLLLRHAFARSTKED